MISLSRMHIDQDVARVSIMYMLKCTKRMVRMIVKNANQKDPATAAPVCIPP
jgi:hypothetical protein